jgi:putative ABC transport system substrate-binding protein
MESALRRRDFIKGAAASATAWPVAAGAQQREQMRRVGVMMNVPADDPEGQLYVAAFQQGLQALGWMVGRNLRLDHRWVAGSNEAYRQAAAELVALAPDVILAAGASVPAVQRATRSIPIVFSQAIDPVGAGFVTSLARPGGNATGFMQFEFSLSAKWLELLRELAPATARIGVLREAANPAGIGQWAVIQAAADSIGVELTPLAVGDANEIERGITAFAGGGSGCLIVAVSARTALHRRTIIAMAARHRLPAVYPYRFMVADGGLLCYGPDLTNQYRRAAEYVDRILKGEKPAGLPVQRPTKYELVVNLKTAKALDLTLPTSILLRADEVIE